MYNRYINNFCEQDNLKYFKGFSASDLQNSKIQYSCKNDNIGESEMSIASSLIADDGILFISDSRSTKNNIIQTDNYKKICYNQRLNCGIMSTGLNEFGSKNFSEIIDEVSKNNPNCTMESFVNVTVNRFLYYTRLSGVYTNLKFGFYQVIENMLSPIVVNVQFFPNQYKGEYNVETERYRLCSNGILWCLKYLENYEIKPESVNVIENKLKETYKQLIHLDNNGQVHSYIGGNVQTLIIRP